MVVVSNLMALLPMCTLAITSRVQIPAAASNSRDMAQRLRYSMNRSATAHEQRSTALLPGAPFIRAVTEGVQVGKVQARPASSVELKCEVVGMPSPTVYWVKGGRPVTIQGTTAGIVQLDSNYMELIGNEGRPSLETATTTAKFVIPCVSRDHAGVYQCIGDNGAGKVIVDTELVVQDGIEGEESEQCGLEEAAPVIFMRTDMRMEYPGNDAQLNCRATGNPAPTIRWYDLENKRIHNDDNYTLVPNGDLLVKSINFAHDQPFRQFTCRATNSIGSDTATSGILAIRPSDK